MHISTEDQLRNFKIVQALKQRQKSNITPKEKPIYDVLIKSVSPRNTNAFKLSNTTRNQSALA